MKVKNMDDGKYNIFPVYHMRKEMSSMDNTEILSADYTRAKKLNNHIKAHAQIAQESLYEVCKGLKEMRDNKLYKQLEYSNFEKYCEQEVGIKWRQAYNYISIAESFSQDSLQSIAKIGTTKLALLAKLDEPERHEIQQTTDLESATVRELKAKIAELKQLEPQVHNLQQANQLYQQENQKLKIEVRERSEEIQVAKMMYDELQDEKDELFAETLSLSDQLDELRSQGEQVIDAVYSDNSEEVERLTARNEELEDELRELRGEINKELARVRTETMKAAAVPDYTHSYRILIQNAKESVARLKAFMKTYPEISGSGYDFFEQVFLTLADMESKLNKG